MRWRDAPGREEADGTASSYCHRDERSPCTMDCILSSQCGAPSVLSMEAPPATDPGGDVAVVVSARDVSVSVWVAVISPRTWRANRRCMCSCTSAGASDWISASAAGGAAWVAEATGLLGRLVSGEVSWLLRL